MENTQIEFHEVADVFPLMSVAEFDELCADIEENGLREAIWLHEGKIIDGRNRYNACHRIGIAPSFREWDRDGSLISFVISLNLIRRNLSTHQRTIIAAKLVNMRQGERTDLNIQPKGVRLSQSEAARLMNVSSRGVTRAAKVFNDGVMELAEKYEAGEISTNVAETIAALPKGKQIRLVKRGAKSLVDYAQNLKVEKKLKKARSTHDLCLICNETVKPTKEDFLSFLYVLETHAGSFDRYVEAIIEEIQSMDTADTAQFDYDKIKLAIELGHQSFVQIQKFTSISREVLMTEIELLLQGKSIEIIAQGGKTSMARGGTTKLYRLAQTAEYYAPDFDDEATDYDD